MSPPPRRRRSGTARSYRGLRIGLRGRVTMAVAAGRPAAVGRAVAHHDHRGTQHAARHTRGRAVACRRWRTPRPSEAGSTTADGRPTCRRCSARCPTGASPRSSSTRSDGAPVPVSVDSRYRHRRAAPEPLRDRVVDDRESAIMRFESDGRAAGGGRHPTARQRRVVLRGQPARRHRRPPSARSASRCIVATALATLLAMALGFWASRYALPPLRRIGEAAESVALGQLDTRIDYDDYANDVDLAPLVANFNEHGLGAAGAHRPRRPLRERREPRAALPPDHAERLASTCSSNNRDELPERSQQALDLLDAGHAALHPAGRGPARDLPVRRRRGPPGARRRARWSRPSRPRSGPSPAEPIPVEADPALDGRRRVVRQATTHAHPGQLRRQRRQVRRRRDRGATSNATSPTRTPDEAARRVRRCASPSRTAVPVCPRRSGRRIFDRFNRGDQGGSRGMDVGVGLGLALAAEHARLQGGRVWVEDRHDGGQGARFVVELPAARRCTTPSAGRRPRRPGRR